MNNAFIGATVAAVALAYILSRNIPQPVGDVGAYDYAPQPTPMGDDVSQLPTLAEQAGTVLSPSTYWDASPSSDDADNIGAFLDLIAYAEGTAGPRGYQTMFGYRYFDSFADHPRQYFEFTDGAGRTLKTSAAGRYQFIVSTWDALRKKLGLQDFSPANQDAACVELIRERGAIADVKAGRITQAIAKCAKTWASLPGAGYQQPERELTKLLFAYKQAGGTLEA